MSDKTLETNRQETRTQIGEEAAASTLALNPVVGVRLEDLVASARATAFQAIRQPLILARNAAGFTRKLMGIAIGESAFEPAVKDRRFQHPAWQNNGFYRGLLQAYLALEDSSDKWVSDADFNDLDERRARFLLRIVIDSIAPTNTLAGNPAALRQAFDTGGASLKNGFQQLLDDTRHNGGMPSQVDKSEFELGENLATTAGTVVFRNELLELIQYQPTTDKVYKRPLLVVPAPINKFYVFDLSPEKSFFRFCLEQGIQLFAVSWRNPSAEHSHWDLDAYINALKEAQEAIRSITRCDDMNLHAPCSGGIIASILLGHLHALGDTSVHSLTLPVCVLTQHEEDSDLSLFVDERSIDASRKKTQKAGVLRGRELAKVFNWMRPNDLIWNYVVNNYLMGNRPPAFDILYWNNDTTNLPAQLHDDFLDIMLGQALNNAGAVTVCDTPIDLGAVDADKYIVAGTSDHLTPWRACYRNTQTFGKNSTFVLSSSGHVQCLINPPGKPKAKYYLNPDLPDSPDQWLVGATEHADSWWLHWAEWLKERSGETKQAPRQLGNRRYKKADAAPGTYFFETSDQYSRKMAVTQTLDIQWLKIDGFTVRVAVSRCDGDGLPLLIFNGIGASVEVLQPFIHAMKGTQVVIYDVPGAGRSAPPRFPWHMRCHARLASKVLDMPGFDEVNTLGVSWGGILAQQFARQFPTKCRRLILAATVPGATMVPGKLAVLLRMSNPKRYMDQNHMRRIAAEIYGGTIRTDPNKAQKHAKLVMPPSVRGYYYQLLALLSVSSLPWLHKLKQPTLILQGDDDPLVPNINARVLATLIPNADLHLVDCGHLFLITRAQELAPGLQEFLRRPLPIS